MLELYPLTALDVDHDRPFPDITVTIVQGRLPQ